MQVVEPTEAIRNHALSNACDGVFGDIVNVFQQGLLIVDSHRSRINSSLGARNFADRDAS